eukprot:10450223-Karenia_brevis.AAC.1
MTLATLPNWRDRWHQFAHHAYAMIGIKVDLKVNLLKIPGEAAPAQKKPRLCPPLQIPWAQSTRCPRVWIGGDSELVVSWILGTSEVNYDRYRSIVTQLQVLMHTMLLRKL